MNEGDEADRLLREMVERTAREMTEQFNRLMYAHPTAAWYDTPIRAPWWERAHEQVKAWARRPFEWLRDRLVSWLGCSCERDW